VLSDTAKWHAFERIAALAPPYIVARPGYAHLDAQSVVLPDVSSSRIRDALTRRAEPAAEALLSAGVPRAVLGYITEHGLYRT
jgi:nicotinic acid mononucleotide adenylyltransferase